MISGIYMRICTLHPWLTSPPRVILGIHQGLKQVMIVYSFTNSVYCHIVTWHDICCGVKSTLVTLLVLQSSTVATFWQMCASQWWWCSLALIHCVPVIAMMMRHCINSLVCIQNTHVKDTISAELGELVSSKYKSLSVTCGFFSADWAKLNAQWQCMEEENNTMQHCCC